MPGDFGPEFIRCPCGYRGTSRSPECPVCGSQIAAERTWTNRVLTGLGLFWCLAVGALTPSVYSDVAKDRNAERRFRPVPAVVLSSRVHSWGGAGKDEHPLTHQPVVRFAYEVNGLRYESDQYAFDGGSSSDLSYTKAVTLRYHEGQPVTAWVDPDRPQVAILAPGPQSRFLLFLGPFWAAGILILLRGARALILDFHTWRYLDRPLRVPCRIPGWGRLRRRGSGLAVTRGPNLVLWVMPPYLLSTFLAILVLDFGGWTNDPRAPDVAFAACLAVTGLTGAVGLFQGHRVRFERDRVVVDRPFRREEMATADVASVEVGEARAAAQPPKPLALYLKARDGRTLGLNVFSISWEANAAVAARARQQVAELLGLAPSGKPASSSVGVAQDLMMRDSQGLHNQGGICP